MPPCRCPEVHGLLCHVVIVPAAKGLSVPRSVVGVASTITLGVAAVAAFGCSSAAAAQTAETAIEEEPELVADLSEAETTEEDIQARIDDAVERALLEAEIEAQRGRQALAEAEAHAPVQPIEMVVNPTLPDAYCEEDPYALVLGIEDDIRAPFDPTRPFNLRIAFKAQSDGRIWVAVEDDADWPTACHVSALGDWVYNPDTGWYHSAAIPVDAE